MNRKKLLKCCSYVTAVILTIIIAMSIFLIIKAKSNPDEIPSFLGYMPMTVLSGSMSPVMQAGDLIIVRSIKPEEVKVGDVITYNMDKKFLVTHRVIEVLNDNKQMKFRTKGDANSVVDEKLVSGRQLIGTLAYKIPYGGYAAKLAASLQGLVLLILIPAFLLIGGELKTILSYVHSKKKQLHRKGNMGIKSE